MRIYHLTAQEEALARRQAWKKDWAGLQTLAVIGTIVLSIFLWPVYDRAGRPLYETAATVIEVSILPSFRLAPARLEHVWLFTPVGKMQTSTLLPVTLGQHVNVFYRRGRSGCLYVDDIFFPDTVKPLQQIQ